MKATLAAIVAWFVVASTSAVFAQNQQAPPQAPVREITQLRGDVYQAREGSQYTVFLVTPDGIILGDPLSARFAQWLKEQFASRFPGVPVRYVVYTHHHFDRAEGGAVFTGAVMVAQAEYNHQLSNSRFNIPSYLGVQDRNENRQLDPSELEGPNAPLLLSKDRNHDGTVTPDELYRLVMSARQAYGDRRTITLGGKQVELVHAGSWHSPEMTVLFFPDERIAFAVDPPPVTAVPFSFGVARAGDIYDWLHAVARLDADTLVLGDGGTLAPAMLRGLTSYLDALRAGVAMRYERWQSLERIQASPVPEEYRGSPQYAGRAAQIASVYRTIRLRQFLVSGVGLANYGRLESAYCRTYTFCSAGGVVPGGTAGAAFLFGRRIGVAGEVMLSQQFWSTRARPLYGEEIAVRQSRGSVLFRFSAARWLALLAGSSMTFIDARGVDLRQGVIAPVGGRHEIRAQASRAGFTTGIDLRVPFGSRVALVLPLRATYIGPDPLPGYWPGHVDANGGVGLSVRLMRRVH